MRQNTRRLSECSVQTVDISIPNVSSHKVYQKKGKEKEIVNVFIFRKFFEFVIIHHFRQCYIHMTKFITPDELLPDGPLPIWIEFPNQKFTQLDILGRVAELEEIRGSSVTVMYPHGKKNDETLAFCKTKNWKYHDVMSMYGLEDEAVIVLDPVHVSSMEPLPTNSFDDLKPGFMYVAPEFITRATSKLIMITSVNNNDK